MAYEIVTTDPAGIEARHILLTNELRVAAFMGVDPGDPSPQFLAAIREAQEGGWGMVVNAAGNFVGHSGSDIHSDRVALDTHFSAMPHNGGIHTGYAVARLIADYKAQTISADTFFAADADLTDFGALIASGRSFAVDGGQYWTATGHPLAESAPDEDRDRCIWIPAALDGSEYDADGYNGRVPAYRLLSGPIQDPTERKASYLQHHTAIMPHLIAMPVIPEN